MISNDPTHHGLEASVHDESKWHPGMNRTSTTVSAVEFIDVHMRKRAGFGRALVLDPDIIRQFLAGESQGPLGMD